MGVKVQVKSNFDDVALPDGHSYRSGKQAILTDAEFSGLAYATSRALTVIQSGIPDPSRPTAPGKVAVDQDPDGTTVLVVSS